jgi:hypothetical protein
MRACIAIEIHGDLRPMTVAEYDSVQRQRYDRPRREGAASMSDVLWSCS